MQIFQEVPLPQNYATVTTTFVQPFRGFITENMRSLHFVSTIHQTAKDNIVRFPTTEISCVIYFTFFRDRFFYLVQIKFELGGGKKLKALWCRNEN